MSVDEGTLTAFLLARIAEDEQRFDLEFRHDPIGEEEAFAADAANRVLADCEAKRRIVEVATAHGTLQSIEILSLLALPYADHPDYQEDWRP